MGMVDVIITYETLFDVLRKEKSRDDLQALPADFFGQVVRYFREKQAEVDAAGGFAAPGAQKPLIQLRNVQKIIRELFQRRERKIIEMALNRARTESNIIDTSTLLEQEQSFYHEIVSSLSGFKDRLLTPLLNGDVPAGVVVPDKPVEVPEEKSEPPPKAQPADLSSNESCSVKFLASVPKFLGLGGETHGPFEPGDQAELPGKIAAVLLKKNRVELA